MTKKQLLSLYFVVTLVAASVATSQAQTVIGMGTEQPNPNAVLELVPEQGNQGFLAPRLTTAQRQASSFTSKLSRADHGLLVFDTIEGQFYYWFNGAWRPGTSGGTGGPNAEVSGTTWYTGTTAPSGVNAAEGDFYINESTGEVFKFSGNAFVTMGNIQGGAANSQTLSSVLQQGGSAGNQKISDLENPTLDSDAATKAYVDTELANVSALNPNLKAVLDQGNNAGNSKITNLGAPTDDKDAANKKYVDDRETATRTYVDQEIAALPPGGSTPSLGQVLSSGVNANSAANLQIIDLAAPSAANHAANRKYVDDRDLENILDRDNDAGGRQITDLGSPTADGHATNREYVDDQDNTVRTEAKITNFVFDSDNNELTLTEGGTPHSVTLSPLAGETPATLPEGNIFVGDNSSSPQAVTITGDISIDAAGLVIIKNARITTAKIANSAVTKEKINADVAGPGLAKDTNVDGLRVNTGNGLIVDSDKVKISPFPDGWIGIGQGLDDDMNFKEVKRDATLNKDGELTVRGIRGRAIANTAPDIDDVLQWDGSAWAPAEVTGGAGAPGTVDAFSGSGDPSGGSGSKGDIYVKDDGTVFIKTKDNSSPGSWSSIPKTFFGNGSPGSEQGNQGDIYVRNNGTIYIKGANGWVDVD